MKQEGYGLAVIFYLHRATAQGNVVTYYAS